jgi:polyhydroxyalkanoate synthesis regulator phasin
MEALFKKFLYTGVGLVASTADKMQTNLTETLDKTKATEKEGEKVLTDLMKDTEAKYNEMEDRFRSAFDSALSRFNLPNLEEFNALKTKVAELEMQLATQKNGGKEILTTIDNTELEEEIATETEKGQ